MSEAPNREKGGFAAVEGSDNYGLGREGRGIGGNKV